MFKIKVIYFLCLCFVLCNSQKNDFIEKIVQKLNAIKSNDVYYINENLFFIKNSNLSDLISNINDVNYINNDYTFNFNGTHDLSDENASEIYDPNEVNNLTNLLNITNDVFQSHSLILRVNDEVDLKISANHNGDNGLYQDFEADFILENQVKQNARGAQIGFLPIMYVLGVMTTMLKVLTFLTLKGLTIGMVLLTVAYTYSIKKHHAHHGHYAHYGTPATIIKTASHSYPHRHIHVPKYHSHYSSFHHPHHHHYPHHSHHHHPHKKYHYSPDYHHHGHHLKHAPEQIEIVKDIHVHSVKPHLYHKHVPETHSHEYVKDGPILEYPPHKHHHSEHHTVKKRYPHPQPAIEYSSGNDDSYSKPPKKSHRSKIRNQSLGSKSPYSVHKDFSKYGAIKENNPNDDYKENGFSPVSQNSPTYYDTSAVSYGGGGGADPVSYVENPVSYAPSYVPESYAVSNMVDNYAGGPMVTGYAGSSMVQGYAGGNIGAGYAGSNMVSDYPSSNMAAEYVGSSITADFGSSNIAGGYAPNTFSSNYNGGHSDESYNTPAPPAQNDVKNEYFTNHKNYMSSNINTEEYSNPVVNNQQEYTKSYSSDGEGASYYQYQNNYSNDEQNKYNGPHAPSYNTDSSYDNVNTYDQNTNEAKYPYPSKNKYTPLIEPESNYKSNASPFFVNIPNLPEEEKSEFGETSDDKKVTSQPNEDSSNYQESMESPIFESSKINNYDSISSSFNEDSSYNDQQPESYSSSSKNNFEMNNERTNSFSSVLKNENSVGSSFHQSRDSFSNEGEKKMQELEFEPAWAYILFNNQNSLENSTSTPSNDLEAETSNPLPVINC